MKEQRPFGQPAITPEQARLIPFRGRAYRFYLLLPRYRRGKEIYTATDARQLFRLLTEDFGGCTHRRVEQAPTMGSWELQEGERPKIVVDYHSEFTVYAKPTKRCEIYFEQLETNLRKHLWERKGLREEQIMIERTEVKILVGKPQQAQGGAQT